MEIKAASVLYHAAMNILLGGYTRVSQKINFKIVEAHPTKNFP